MTLNQSRMRHLGQRWRLGEAKVSWSRRVELGELHDRHPSSTKACERESQSVLLTQPRGAVGVGLYVACRATNAGLIATIEATRAKLPGAHLRASCANSHCSRSGSDK